MEVVAVVAPVALAAVFAVSGIAKMLDRAGTREAVAGFGVPRRLVPVVAAGLAPAELAVAALLLTAAGRVPGLVVALVLLAGFTAAVVVALATGRRPECHCFGRIGGADVSARTILRNAVLAGLAVLGLVGVARTDAGPSGGRLAAAVLGGLAVAGLVLLGEGLAGRAARRARERADEAAYERGLADPDRAAAPPFQLPTLAGPERSLSDLLAAGLPTLLVFLSPGCGPCKTMRPAVTRWAEVYAGRVTVAVVAGGRHEANLAAYDDSVPGFPVLVDEEDDVRKGYGLIGTPSAALVDPDGLLRGGPAAGERLVRRLLAAALTGSEVDTGHRADDGVPADSLDLGSIPRPRPTVTAHARDDGTVLVDEAVGSSLVLDQIGGIVWTVLDGTSPLEEIVADLADAFGAPPEVVGPDVLEMVRTLGRSGMLEGVAPEALSDAVDTGHEHAHAH